MRRIHVTGSFLALMSLCMLTLSFTGAESPLRWRGSPGWEPESAYCKLYDAHTVATVSGKIIRLEKMTPMKGMGAGVHFMLKTEQETIPVHLGPIHYVESQSIQLKTGDVVEVTGSRVPCDGKPVILAAMVKRGNDVLTLRDLKGRPMWGNMRP